MPNHVTTVCTVTGSPADIDRFMSAHFGKTDDGADWFKFETVIPQPECVGKTEDSSQSDAGFFALTGLHETKFGAFCESPMHRDARAGTFTMGPVTTREEYLSWLEHHDPRAIELGRAALECFLETGYRNWYAWRIANWGTKWGAYDCEIRQGAPDAIFKFETAWSFPLPIFRKLSEMYPEIVFSVVSFDECWNFACTGEFNGRNNFANVGATPELYEQVYGVKYERDEEDADQ